MNTNKKLWDIEIRILARQETIARGERRHAVTKDKEEQRVIEAYIWDEQRKIGNDTIELETLTRYLTQQGTA